MTRNRDRTVGLLACVALAVGLWGCEDQRRHQASEDLKLLDMKAPLRADASPEDVANALLMAIRDLQQVRMEGLGSEDNRDRYERSLAEIVSLMDHERVHEYVRDPKRHSPMVPLDIKRAPAVKLVAESWVSMVAHYVDGFSSGLKMGAARITSGRRGDARMEEAEVVATVESPREREIVERVAAEAGAGPAGSEEWKSVVEPLALAEGVHIPIETTITFRLSRVNGSWRVHTMNLGPGEARVAAGGGGSLNEQDGGPGALGGAAPRAAEGATSRPAGAGE